VTNSVASTLMLLDDNTGELVFSVPTGPQADRLTDMRLAPGKGIAGWVAEHEQPLLIPNVREDPRFYREIDKISGFETRSILCVPLKAKMKLIGVLEAINKADGTFFTEEDEVLLSVFAYQAAMAIENARLYGEVIDRFEEEQQMRNELAKELTKRKVAEESIRQRNRELSILNAMAGVVSQSLNVEEILNSGLKAVLELMNLNIGWIYLADPEHCTLGLTTFRGVSKKFSDAIRTINVDEKTLQAVESKDKLKRFILSVESVIKDRAELARILSAMREERLGLTSTVFVLLQAKDEILGLLVVSSQERREYSESELELLTSIGQQLSISIQNAQLYRASQRELGERKRAQQALRQSEERYRSVVEASIQGILIIQDSIIQFANQAAADTFGYSNRKELIGLDIRETLIAPREQRELERRANEVVLGKSVSVHHGWQGIRRDGTLIWIQSTASLISWRNKPAILSFMIDITEGKRSEEALRESEVRYRTLVESSSDAILMLDRDRKIVSCNQAFLDLFGYKRNEVEGESIRKIHRSDDSFASFGKTVYPVIAGVGTYRTEWDFVHKNGSKILVETVTSGIKAADGSIRGYVAIIRDITDRKKAEERLKSSERELRNLAAHLQFVRETERTSIAREIHDELGQALTALKIDMSWLKKRLPKDQQGLLEKTNSISKLTDMTIKAVKRISTELRPGILDDLGLVAAIEWQTEEFQSRTGIECRLRVSPEDITVEEKRSTALFRIFQETLTNVARHSKATAIKASLGEKAGTLELKVIDNGKGITEEQIYDPRSFGLMGMRERVRPWGGKVKIKGTPIRGTTVTVSVPTEKRESVKVYLRKT
jgi:PAS domain S-box-containing protein